MKTHLGRILVLSVLALLPNARADEESVLVARDGSSRSEGGETGILLASSRSVAAPAPKATPVASRSDSGVQTRVTVHKVVVDQSYLVLKTDASESHYRFTKGTQFMDESGRVLSPDAIKSGTNATLYYTRTDDDTLLSKVIVNDDPRPLQGGYLQARVDE